MVENPGIDPGTSHMLSERFTIWANSPSWLLQVKFCLLFHRCDTIARAVL